jgi:hypothetical protein
VKPLLTKVKRERRKFECKGCKERRVWVAFVSNRHTRKRRERSERREMHENEVANVIREKINVGDQ